MTITVQLPIKIISEANAHGHWRERAKRAKLHRATTLTLLQAWHGTKPPAGRMRITMTRIAPRTLDDDNLAGGFKATRDGVADWLGIDDGSPLLMWRYAQRKGGPREYAAEVRIEGVA